MGKISLLLAFLMIPGILVSAEKVALYLESDITSEKIAEISPEDSRLSIAEPVMDEDNRAEGWYWMEYRGDFTGFVELKDVAKDLSVRPGALVYLRATYDSPVFTVITEEDAAELIFAQDWAEISFSKAVPVYFKHPAKTVPVLRFGKEGEASPTVQPEDSDRVYLPGAVPTVYTNPASENPPRYFEGTFEKATSWLGQKPKFKFQIVTGRGKRIAYVDISSLLATKPMKNYLDKKVLIYGGAIALDESKQIVVYARTLRLR